MTVLFAKNHHPRLMSIEGMHRVIREGISHIYFFTTAPDCKYFKLIPCCVVHFLYCATLISINHLKQSKKKATTDIDLSYSRLPLS